MSPTVVCPISKVKRSEITDITRLAMLSGLTHPRVLWHAAMTVSVYFLLLTEVYRALIEALGGIRPGAAETLMIVASVAVMSNVPISLNGLGVREQLHAALFAPLGVSREVAVAISLLLFAHGVLISVAGGLLWLRTERAPVRNPISLG